MAKKEKRVKERQPQSYVALHNRAVIRYRQASRIIIWAGVVNFVGLLIGVVQYYASESVSAVPFYFCFGINDFLFTLIQNKIPQVWFWIIVSIMLLITTAGAVLLGVFASQGKKKCLIGSAIGYLVDWGFVLLSYFVAGETMEGLLLSGGIHLIISFFLVMALYQYKKVLTIEDQFEKPIEKEGN